MWVVLNYISNLHFHHYGLNQEKTNCVNQTIMVFFEKENNFCLIRSKKKFLLMEDLFISKFLKMIIVFINSQQWYTKEFCQYNENSCFKRYQLLGPSASHLRGYKSPNLENSKQDKHRFCLCFQKE